jgi:PAS domain S-box-containing protein
MARSKRDDQNEEVAPSDDMPLPSLWAWGERIAQIGCWEYVPAEQRLLWSDNLYRIFGLEPGDVQPSLEYVLDRTHPDDRGRVEFLVRDLVERGDTRTVDYRITQPDGDRRYLRSWVAVTEERDGRPHRFVGVVQDLTDDTHAEHEIATHVAVAEALVAWEALEPGAHRLLARLAAALNCVEGVFWVPRDDILVARAVWHERQDEQGSAAATIPRPLRRPSGLPGRAWDARKPLSWALGDAASPPDVARGGEGRRGAIAIPALMGNEVLAVVELKTDREFRIGERLMRSLYGIAHELGHFLARRRGELAAPLLTAREIEVLQLAAEGLSAPRIAARLGVSPSTARTHLENIYVKLEISDRSSAVATALRLGLID